MTKRFTFTMMVIMAMCSLTAVAQNVTLRGVYQTSRDNAYPNGEYSEYVGWSYNSMRPIFIVQQGLYKMEWDGATLTMPEKFPAINKQEFSSNATITDEAKAL